MDSPVFAPAGPAAVVMTVAESPSEATLLRMCAVKQYLQDHSPAWLIDVVVGYVSLYIHFDPLATDIFAVKKALREEWRASQSTGTVACKTHVLPVYYDQEFCPDLDVVAAMKGLTVDQVITLHSGLVYRVYALGFAPGFAYLGEIDEQLIVPRLASPRQRVPAGAVAIAERQTAVYPSASPAGWHVLGLCPHDLRPNNEALMPLLSVGDEVRFEAVSQEVFLSLGGTLEVVV